MSPRKRSRNVLRAVLWGSLGVWALALGVFYLTRSARANPAPGEQMLAPGVAARSVEGGWLPLLARDSVVAVLAATSECAACRTGVPSYRDLAARLKEEGVAFRVIVGSDSLPARQYSRLLPDAAAVVWDPGQKLFRSLGVRAVPSLYLVGRDGKLVKMWLPLPADSGMVERVAAHARAAR